MRTAVPGDAHAIATAHVAAWRAAYVGTMPQDYLDALDADRWAAGWAEHLGAGPVEGDVVLVAELDGAVVGFAACGRAAGDDDGPAADDGRDHEEEGRLHALNVAPQAWGRGCGRALLGAAHDALRAVGVRTAHLWVVPSNARARDLYERGGWTCDEATRIEDVNGVSVPAVRYRRSLDGA